MNYIAFFSAIAILISSSGLFAISSIVTTQREKEMAIRKISGASNVSIAALLNRRFVFYIAISIVIGAPISTYLTNWWLESFYYKTHIGIWPMILSSIVICTIALATVALHVSRVAFQNPVNNLRNS